jgi:hypothetical protein
MKLVILSDTFKLPQTLCRWFYLPLVPSLEYSGYEDFIVDVKVLKLKVKK